MRRSFGQGRDWWEVLSEGRRRGTAAQDVARWKEAYKAAGTSMPAWVVTRPVAGELTVAEIDPAAPTGQAETVLAWARSVAQGRVLTST